MAPIASERHFQTSTENLQALEHLSDLLHLFHHRNKNQHRRSHWYRHFSIFRRQLSHFISDLQTLNAIPTTNLARTKKKSEHLKIIARTQQRLEFWRDVMFTKWQHAFGQVVADGRFSVLGLVLVAILAEVGNVVGIVRELEEMGQIEVEKVLGEFAREEREWDEGTPLTREVEDEGEVVRRDEIVEVKNVDAESKNAGPDEMSVEDTLSKKRPATETTTPKPKKKRKKGGNAIDDIFG